MKIDLELSIITRRNVEEHTTVQCSTTTNRDTYGKNLSMSQLKVPHHLVFHVRILNEVHSDNSYLMECRLCAFITRYTIHAIQAR